MNAEKQNALQPPMEQAANPAKVEVRSLAVVEVEERSDEMHDTGREREKYPDLPLAECSSWLPDFTKADALALEFQKSHIGHARAAALFGTVAVVAAIVELLLYYNPNAGHWKQGSAFLEITCVAAAVLSAIHGLGFKKKRKWLSYRHQAELYRQLKFKLLIHPRVWKDAAWLRSELQRIASIGSKQSLEEEIEGPPPHGPLEVEEQSVPWPVLRQLVEYYVSKRLNPQKTYLAGRALHNQYKDLFLRWPDFLFVASVLAAGIHYVLFSFEPPGTPPAYPLSVGTLGLLLAAACLPVIAAGARTWRSAFEFSRNKSRFRSAHAALEQVEGSLLHDALAGIGNGFTADRPSSDPQQDSEQSLKVLRQLWWAEHIQCNEHHEWLRLMLETEWYG